MIEIIKESSLSRLYSKMVEHDCATLTAHRNNERDEKGNIVKKYTYKENQLRNKELLLLLLKKGYRVTKVRGVYIQDYKTPQAVEVGENVFFVEDIDDKGKLKKDIMELGEKYNQDSVLYIPKGGEKAILIGTNHTADFPGYHKEVVYSSGKWGRIGEFMTKIRNRPFFFESIEKEFGFPDTYFGKMGLQGTLAEVQKELNSL